MEGKQWLCLVHDNLCFHCGAEVVIEMDSCPACGVRIQWCEHDISQIICTGGE